MISDSITNASASAAPSARDMGKKKRVINNVFFVDQFSFNFSQIRFLFVGFLIAFGVSQQTNRAAKLKQSKLGLRREQWLSQGMILKDPIFNFRFLRFLILIF